MRPARFAASRARYHSCDRDGAASRALRSLVRSEALAPPREWPHASEGAWLGANGATAAAHYDASHNLFVQVLAGARRRSAGRPPPAADPRALALRRRPLLLDRRPHFLSDCSTVARIFSLTARPSPAFSL